jgi:hypothetical protein
MVNLSATRVDATIGTVITVAADDAYGLYLVDATSNSINLTLMNVQGYDGASIIFRRLESSGNVVTLSGFNTSQRINTTGVFTDSVVVPAGGKIQVVSYGNNWYVL